MPAFSNAFPSPCLLIRPAAVGTRAVRTGGLWRTCAASGLLRTKTASTQSACRPRAAWAGAGGKGFSCATNGHAVDGIKRSTTLCRPQCARKTLSKCCRLRRRPPSGLRDLGTRARRGRFDQRGPIQSLEKSGLCGEKSSPLSRRRFLGRCRCSRARPFCPAISGRAWKEEALLKQERCPRVKVGKWLLH